MEEEIKPNPQQEDLPKLSAMEKLKLERLELEKIKDAIKADVDRLEALKTEEILSGRADAGSTQVAKVETPQEYAKRIASGQV